MARLFRRSALALTLLAALAAAPARGQALPPGFFDQPVLVVDPGRHTARIVADVDPSHRLVVTASADKTMRIWSLASGALNRVIRLPSGPALTGQPYNAAIDPQGEFIAISGWLTAGSPGLIYLYSLASGSLTPVAVDAPNGAFHVAFSPNGEHLAVILARPAGVRLLSRAAGWAEISRDDQYAAPALRASFSPDGRLAVTSLDGSLRIYGPGFARPWVVRAPGGNVPMLIAFSPDGQHAALGYNDTPRVDVLDAATLAFLYSADTNGIDNGNLHSVAWLSDGTLAAAGSFDIGMGVNPILIWADKGRAPRRMLMTGALDTVASLHPLPGRELLVASTDPWLGRVAADGGAGWQVSASIANFRGLFENLAISADGAVVDFKYDGIDGVLHARFDLAKLELAVSVSDTPIADGRTVPPRQLGARFTGLHGSTPAVDGRRLRLHGNEIARSVAVHPDQARFVLGADWSLRAFTSRGDELWREPVPGTVWAVNITGDGRLVVAAYADGTIRWHRMDDGREILAFMPLADRTNWVAWTPEGFYAASPGAHGVLRWHVNRPDFQPADSLAVSDIPGFYRPAVIPLVLQELETARAIGIATIAEQRRKVQLAANSRLPPGAKLHLLAVGVSRYNDRHGRHLRLDFAHQDAHDVASALSGTQDALYVPGSRQYLPNEDATRAGMLRALDTLRATMGHSDLAVVHFAGHGAMVDGELFLLPHEVDARDAVAIRASALNVSDLRSELLKIAERGRVLVLLDACYSGAASADGRAATVDSARLTQALAAANISVLTSSSADQISREDSAWQNGAFTEAVLEALGPDADENRDGLISATELAAYVERRVRALTGGRQSPAMELRFGGTLFAVR
jgi:WD40 repeat protein